MCIPFDETTYFTCYLDIAYINRPVTGPWRPVWDKRRHLPPVEFEKFYFFIIMFHFMDCFRQTLASGRDMSFHIPHSVMIISNMIPVSMPISNRYRKVVGISADRSDNVPMFVRYKKKLTLSANLHLAIIWPSFVRLADIVFRPLYVKRNMRFYLRSLIYPTRCRCLSQIYF